ncbi:hypothetical protein CCZ01_01350 [Helicobacter monodelphidis]|uniref:lytic transglycosylase domain-containing protein n=1 Tax=Helicobacter sp. 15-1451 TaxID=2004995 RepID=UPI000DCD677D|nr:lytic transglycosylase domain-containing protein [Helicobacter sp. 15-1451]RAX58870.1 hypothetical protein CCZ01_01350 [Helicobacter sp. 15-1451]
MKIFYSLILLFLISPLSAAFDTAYRGNVGVVFEKFDVNPSFVNSEDFITFQTNMDEKLRARNFLKGFEGGERFIPLLKQKIKEAGIPQEFLYLALVESNFSPKSKSPKKATGIWQFMPKTAKMVGLRVDSQIDERLDPVRSTEGAIAYLKYLHDTFGKWYLAAIAYNCGDGRLMRAIEQAGTDELEVLLDSEEAYIPQESRNYIRKILYVSLLLSDVDALKEQGYEYLLNRGIGGPSISSIRVSASPLVDIAKQAGMSVSELKKYNHHIKKGRLPKGGVYNLYIPYESLSTYRSNEFSSRQKQRFALANKHR